MHSGRIDPETGCLVKKDDRDNDIENAIEKPIVLSQRQHLLLSIMRDNESAAPRESESKFSTPLGLYAYSDTGRIESPELRRL